MSIDHGNRRRLIIEGVFDGLCGESEGVLAFIPNRNGKRPAEARGGLLDGAPVILSLVSAPAAGRPFCSFRFRVPE